jgi:DNA-binding CsgD family transcriptional regulator
MSSIAANAEVVGREAELEAIDRFLGSEAGRALVLEGEPGIGKTTLWRVALERARALGQHVLAARPAPVETSLALAGLGDLVGDVADSEREELPEVQRRALAAALAEDGPGSSHLDVRVLGVAVLGLLGSLAAAGPVLLAIDDLQWLDEASGAVVVYAFRRLRAENVRLLAACRGEPGDPLPFDLDRALDERSPARLPLGPLSEGAIRRLLRLRLGLGLSRVELHALYEATGGNPFHALELGRAGPRTDETGSILLPASVQRLVGRRLRALPEPTREALPFVAALADRNASVLARAGVLEALEPAIDAEVLESEEGRLRFVHPLVCAAVWAGTSDARRSEIHRSLAEAVEDLEQRAQHLAAAAEPPAAEVAGLLEEAARSAQRRGAPAAAADLLDRARALAPADADRLWARLAARAAAAHAEAGHWDSVRELVEEAQARLPPGRERAEILVTEAEMRPGLEDAFRQAVAEAGESAAGVRALIGLAEQAGLAGRWAESVEMARQATALARSLEDRALLGVALSFLGGLKLLDTQLDGRREIGESLAIEDELGGLPTSVYESPRMWQGAALLFGDDPGRARPIFEERLAVASERGDDLSAFQFMQLLVFAELRAGNPAAARTIGRSALERVETLGYDYGRPIILGALSAVEAHDGDLDRARTLGTESVSVLTAFGDRLWSTHVLAALLLTELCAGDAAAAIAHAEEISGRFPDRECWWSYHQGDEIEALLLAGEQERALARVEALRRAGAELELPRFLAWAERGEGLVQAARGNLVAAESAFEAALAHHERFPLPFERARTLLAYGHVLRRETRRRAARAALGEALTAFEQLGARHFLAAARAELKHVGGRPPAGEHELTGAEDRIAHLVASGLSNKEVAAQLFVTVSTVEATLTRVYAKLGLSSRSQLTHLLTEHPVRD